MDIFAFADYRSFLTTYFDDAGVSLQHWANELGLGSKSTLAMILNGQRRPGPRVRKAFCRYFKFSARQAAYFDSLVELHRKQDEPEARIELLEKASKLNPRKTFKLLDHAAFSAVSRWYCHAIREMVRLKGFREDARWISEQLNFPVKPANIERAIDDLITAGLLERDASGQLIQAVGEVTSTDEIASEALKRFHEQSLQNALGSVRSISVEKRYLSGTTLTIKSEKLAAAKALIRKFEQEFIDLFEENEGDVTVQLGMNIVPLTKKQPEGECENVAH